MDERNAIMGGMKTTLKAGFRYRVEHWRGNVLLSTEVVDNLVPTQGMNDMLSVHFKGGSQKTSWFLGIFEGNYTPSASDTAATIAAAATECTTYTSATRPVWTGGAVAAGAVSNTDAKAEFTFTAAKTIYGGFLVSSSTKSGTSGVLASAVRFATAKTFEINDILRLAAGITLVSA